MKLRNRFASRAFREYICQQGCAHCRSFPSTPAHRISRKRANGSDALCIPLCLNCHRMFDDWGKQKVLMLWVKWRIDISALHARLWEGFLRKHGLPRPELITQLVFEALVFAEGLSEPPYSKRKNRKPF